MVSALHGCNSIYHSQLECGLQEQLYVCMSEWDACWFADVDLA